MKHLGWLQCYFFFVAGGFLEKGGGLDIRVLYIYIVVTWKLTWDDVQLGMIKSLWWLLMGSLVWDLLAEIFNRKGAGCNWLDVIFRVRWNLEKGRFLFGIRRQISAPHIFCHRVFGWLGACQNPAKLRVGSQSGQIHPRPNRRDVTRKKKGG